MEIGNLNQRITILEHRTVIDEISNHITKWEETFSLWANVTVETASETTDAGITKEVQKLEFSRSSKPCITEHQQHQFPYTVPKQYLQHHRNYSPL